MKVPVYSQQRVNERPLSPNYSNVDYSDGGEQVGRALTDVAHEAASIYEKASVASAAEKLADYNNAIGKLKNGNPEAGVGGLYAMQGRNFVESSGEYMKSAGRIREETSKSLNGRAKELFDEKSLREFQGFTNEVNGLTAKHANNARTSAIKAYGNSLMDKVASTTTEQDMLAMAQTYDDVAAKGNYDSPDEFRDVSASFRSGIFGKWVMGGLDDPNVTAEEVQARFDKYKDILPGEVVTRFADGMAKKTKVLKSKDTEQRAMYVADSLVNAFSAGPGTKMNYQGAFAAGNLIEDVGLRDSVLRRLANAYNVSEHLWDDGTKKLAGKVETQIEESRSIDVDQYAKLKQRDPMAAAAAYRNLNNRIRMDTIQAQDPRLATTIQEQAYRKAVTDLWSGKSGKRPYNDSELANLSSIIGPYAAKLHEQNIAYMKRQERPDLIEFIAKELAKNPRLRSDDELRAGWERGLSENYDAKLRKDSAAPTETELKEYSGGWLQSNVDGVPRANIPKERLHPSLRSDPDGGVSIITPASATPAAPASPAESPDAGTRVPPVGSKKGQLFRRPGKNGKKVYVQEYIQPDGKPWLSSPFED